MKKTNFNTVRKFFAEGEKNWFHNFFEKLNGNVALDL